MNHTIPDLPKKLRVREKVDFFLLSFVLFGASDLPGFLKVSAYVSRFGFCVNKLDISKQCRKLCTDFRREKKLLMNLCQKAMQI